jgi:hypothetical protein
MKLTRMTALLIVLGFVLLVAVIKAEAGERKFKFRASGSGISSPIDTNGDGIPASSTTIRGSSNLGPVSIHAVNETKLALSNPGDPTSVVPCQLPDDSPGLVFSLVQAHSVYRVGSGDLFVGQASGGAGNCLKLTCFGAPGQILPGCVFSSNIDVAVIGGTGRFSGASGLIELNGMGTIVLPHPTGLFVGFSAEGTGTLVIPDN